MAKMKSVDIMSNRIVRRRQFTRKLARAVAAVAVLTTPTVVGVLNTATIRAQSTPGLPAACRSLILSEVLSYTLFWREREPPYYYEGIKGEAMRKLRIIEHISLDGVIQAPGGKGEDGDYPYGGWSAQYDDPELGEAIVAAHSEPHDLLLGRRTYDIWSGHWPKAKGPFADAINAATKYIATHRPDSLKWGPVEGFGPDIAAGVRRIKAKNGPDLILWGSSTLTPVLIEQGLADEVMLLTYPVLLGTGKRFFSDGTPPRELALLSSKAGSSGVIMNIYKPSGPLRTGDHS